MPYDPIQGQHHRGQKRVKMDDFNNYLHIHVIKRLMVNYDTPRQYLNFNQTIFDIRPFLSSRDLQTQGVPHMAYKFASYEGLTDNPVLGLVLVIDSAM